MMTYAKKSLGQHFLTSEGAVDSILDAGDIVGDDIILEIGPGKGVLTQKLLLFGGKVIAIEKDKELIPYLKEKFSEDIKKGKFDLVEKDALDFDLEILRFYGSEYKLIANIPYYITGQIIRKFLETSFQPERMVLMVQKEVAERIVGSRGHRVSTFGGKGEGKESVLSISVKAYGKPKYIKTVKAGSFFPIPKVDSAILLIDEISKDFFNTFSEHEFFKLLHAGFKSKRKKLSSNLSQAVPKDRVEKAFKKLGLDPNLRAEDVSVETWKDIAQEILK